jgi:hypothetical protein
VCCQDTHPEKLRTCTVSQSRFDALTTKSHVKCICGNRPHGTILRRHSRAYRRLNMASYNTCTFHCNSLLHLFVCLAACSIHASAASYMKLQSRPVNLISDIILLVPEAVFSVCTEQTLKGKEGRKKERKEGRDSNLLTPE